MTIVDASSKLFTWFSKNDYFSLETNFKEIVLISLSPEEDKACVKCALEDLEKLDLIKSSESKGKKIWVLKRAFDTFEQTVSISYQTANSIALIVNSFCENINDTSDQCNPANITHKDMKNVVIICQHIMKPLEEKT